jgi:outer membrane efflux protein
VSKVPGQGAERIGIPNAPNPVFDIHFLAKWRYVSSLERVRKRSPIMDRAISSGPTPIAILLLIVMAANRASAQGPPVLPNRPWHSADERQLARETQRFRQSRFHIDADKVYSLAELIDLAEAHNPETRVAWENARAQAAALGISRSELYPTLSAVAVSGVDRSDAGSASGFYRQTMPDSQLTLNLNYTI